MCIRDSVSHAAPDVKGRVLAACENEKGRVLPMTQAKKRRRFLPLIAAVVAVAVVLTCVAGFAIFSGGTGNTGTSIVMLDVNPSISLAVDGNELVTQVQALNKDAETVLGTMELTGVKLDLSLIHIFRALQAVFLNVRHMHLKPANGHLALLPVLRDNSAGAEHKAAEGVVPLARQADAENPLHLLKGRVPRHHKVCLLYTSRCV